MSAKSVAIYINELKSGMILSKNIYSNDVLLAAKGVILDEATIASLKEKLIFEKVEVYSNDSGKAAQVNFTNEKSVEEIKKSFDGFTSVAKNIFGNLNNDYLAGIQDVRKFAKKIHEEVSSEEAIVKNVVLYGSGHDSIYRHSVNVAALSSILAGWLGLEETKINLLTYSAILHDYGKTKLDSKLLNKIEALTSSEFKEIKKHPVLGYEDIKKIQYLDSSVSYGVLMHHERLDGTGYPFGIKEDKIHDFAKIIAIADVFDAVNSNRSYKVSKGPFEVLEVIQKESLGRLDYEYCKIFLEHIINYYMGENVLLDTGEICRIVQININDLTRPLLLGDNGFIDLKKEIGINVIELVV